MVITSEKSRMIRDIHRAYPYWKESKIAELVGVSRQRVNKILKTTDERVTINENMVTNSEVMKIGNEPLSATQVSDMCQIPYSVVAMWVKRKLVKVVHHPGHAARGKFVLLDPEDLKARILLYKPKKRK